MEPASLLIRFGAPAALNLVKAGIQKLTRRSAVVNSALKGFFIEYPNLSAQDEARIRAFIKKWTDSTYFNEYWEFASIRGTFEVRSGIESCVKCHGFEYAIGSLLVEDQILPSFLRHLTVERSLSDQRFKEYRTVDTGSIVAGMPNFGAVVAPGSLISRAKNSSVSRHYDVLAEAESLAFKGQLTMTCPRFGRH